MSTSRSTLWGAKDAAKGVDHSSNLTPLITRTVPPICRDLPSATFLPLKTLEGLQMLPATAAALLPPDTRRPLISPPMQLVLW